MAHGLLFSLGHALPEILFWLMVLQHTQHLVNRYRPETTSNAGVHPCYRGRLLPLSSQLVGNEFLQVPPGVWISLHSFFTWAASAWS